MQITETRVNVTLGGGKAVHTGLRVVQDGVTYKATAECGGNKAGERYRETTAEVTCKRCLKLLAALAEAEAAYQDRLEASMSPATEAHDLGYVAPVDERTETPQLKPSAKATPAQLTALRVIADNPGKVIAMVRGNREFLTINGNVENKLSSLGMIQARHAGTTVTNGKTHELKVWELTESGSDALSTEDRAEAEAAQPDKVREVRETARNAAEDARRDAAILRATLKLSAPAGVPAEQATLAAQRVRDAAHAEALSFLDRVSVPDSEDLRRDLEAVVAAKELCTCGHGAHKLGPCYVGQRLLEGGGCDCGTYVPSGLEGVYDPQTKVWGVRVQGTQAATWLPFTPTRGGLSRKARVDLVRRMVAERSA